MSPIFSAQQCFKSRIKARRIGIVISLWNNSVCSTLMPFNIRSVNGRALPRSISVMPLEMGIGSSGIGLGTIICSSWEIPLDGDYKDKERRRTRLCLGLRDSGGHSLPGMYFLRPATAREEPRTCLCLLCVWPPKDVSQWLGTILHLLGPPYLHMSRSAKSWPVAAHFQGSFSKKILPTWPM